MSSAKRNEMKRTLDFDVEEVPSKIARKEGCAEYKGNIKSSSPEIGIRGYQQHAYQIALMRNTIVCMETGSGKTMIAVMLIKEISRQMKSQGEKNLIIFMAPTVHLVNQQTKVIKVHTGLQVEEYYGAKGVDDWNFEIWQKEIHEKEVMVMTPQILLDALRNAFLRLSAVRLLILDECHRASGNHPYAKIMLEHYHKLDRKPKVFGMTASPINKKGVSSTADCETQISGLEGLLDSKIFTLEDRTELEMYTPMAKEIKKYYKSWSSDEQLKEKLLSLFNKFKTTITPAEDPTEKQLMGNNERGLALMSRLSRFHQKILYCLDNLGLLCAYEAVKVCMRKDGVANDYKDTICSTSKYLLRDYLKAVLDLFEGHLPPEIGTLLGTEACLDPAHVNLISSKLLELVSIIRGLGDNGQVLCMIFVQRIVTAKVISWLIGNLKSLSYLSCTYLTGNTSVADGLTVKKQKSVVESFHEGKVNLLITTDVAEEGIDVQNCSCVIRFDLPKSIRSYIQSRGRARQADSLYELHKVLNWLEITSSSLHSQIFSLPPVLKLYKLHFVLEIFRGNEQQRDLLCEIYRSEMSMWDATSTRALDECIPKFSSKDETPVYTVSSTGAIITANSSVTLIHNYCRKLPGDKYYTPRPIFRYNLCGALYVCKLTLPSSAPFQHLEGPPAKKTHYAKQLVCLDACKRLHQLGMLDDHLLPVNEVQVDCNMSEVDAKSAPGAGTTGRKELHGSVRANALCGTWAKTHNSITLWAYGLLFSCNLIEEQYPGFVLLIKEELDEDVAHAEVDLYLPNGKMVKARSSPYGQVHLDMNQLKKSKSFHELFFNGLFGRLFHISKGASGEKQRTLVLDDQSLWTTTNMYLVLPMALHNNGEFQNNSSIDWEIIDSCFSAAEILKNGCYQAVHNGQNSQNDKGLEDIHLANTTCDFNALKDIVVLAINTARIYYVTDVMNDTTADSPFESSHFSSYTDYFKKKYGITLSYSGQSLLRLKQSHNPHNLLSSHDDHKDGSLNRDGKPVPDSSVKGFQSHVHMPPELLVCLNVSRHLLKSLYLLPSLLHRMESIILASQLRNEVCSHPSSRHIPVLLVLEALTTKRCSENFSMERLELLGDSVLKYVVSCNLFLKYPDKHEGQLSSRRSWAVCNKTLHKLAISRKLQSYVRDAPFDPLRWVAPGQRTLRPVPCKCGIETSEVPLTYPTEVENNAIKIGMTCDRGHRWLCSKTISDCLEALIGAYYVNGGLKDACLFMTWVGVDAKHEEALLEQVTTNASTLGYDLKDIEYLESKLGYKFLNKGLLVEAITHPSQEASSDGCYQRLEFLGDSVLDILITWYLFETHKDTNEGELSDLRSASVNNEKFAQAAVKHNLYQHLRHDSELLAEHIAEYVNFLQGFSEDEDIPAYNKLKGPKVLGDLVESIAGAILIDSKLDLGEVWRVFKPILSPLPTPEDLHLHPVRELSELCCEVGLPLSTECMKEGDQLVAKLMVQLKDGQLMAEGRDKTKTVALEQASLVLLDEMERRGISHKRSIWRGKTEEIVIPNSSATALPSERNKVSLCVEHQMKDKPTALCSPTLPNVSIDMKKGGPRTTLYELCRTTSWVRPTFESRASGLRFISKAILHVPDSDIIEAEGKEENDKKSSMDSAAVALLYKLGELGKCIIK